MVGRRGNPSLRQEEGREGYSQISVLLCVLTFMDMLNHCRAYPDQSFVRSSRSASHVLSRRARNSHTPPPPSIQREARPATEREPLTRPVLRHHSRKSVKCAPARGAWTRATSRASSVVVPSSHRRMIPRLRTAHFPFTLVQED